MSAEEAAQRARERLAALVDDACDVVESGLRGKGAKGREATVQRAYATLVLDLVLGRAHAPEPSGGKGKAADKVDPREAWAELQRRHGRTG